MIWSALLLTRKPLDIHSWCRFFRDGHNFMSLCMYSHSVKWEILRLRLVLSMQVLSMTLTWVFLFQESCHHQTELSVFDQKNKKKLNFRSTYFNCAWMVMEVHNYQIHNDKEFSSNHNKIIFAGLRRTSWKSIILKLDQEIITVNPRLCNWYIMTSWHISELKISIFERS